MQIFPRTLNFLPLVAALGLAVGGGVVTFVVAYYFSPWNTQVGYAPVQPVPFSHRLHAGQLGMDCRYCHAQIERSYEAMVPSTQTCMGCHVTLHGGGTEPHHATRGSVQPLFDSWFSVTPEMPQGEPVEWVRVHNLPDHVYFDHSVHLSAGVGCVSCHGRIDQMEVVRQDQPLSMAWCLDCHRDPEPNLRPVAELTTMIPCRDPNTGDVATDPHCWSRPDGMDAHEYAMQLVQDGQRYVVPPENCGGCHR
jgi:hypothetical protein